jgi:hypothetical protein
MTTPTDDELARAQRESLDEMDRQAERREESK